MSTLQDPLSVSSSSSTSSDVSGITRSTSLSAGIPFVRKRLQHEQTRTLLTVFEHRTHPSKEERALLASQLGMEMKAVSAWFQNKRRGLKKKNLAWRRASLPDTRSENLPLHASKLSRSLSRQVSGLSLDCIASSRERYASRILSVVGDPLRPPLASRALNVVKSAAPASKPDADLWEHIPSSPPAPPSSPAAESMRLSVLPARSRTMRSLEWACAKARAGGSVQEEGMDTDVDCDVPPLVLDISAGDADMDDSEDTEPEDFEAITPDASAGQIQLTPSPSPVGMKKKKAAPPAADMEAAMALLGFMGKLE